ncbi:unnamed protein product, partial [Ixodes persulcatus]
IPQETEDRQRSSSSEKGWKKHRSKTTIISALMTFVAIFLVVASVVLMKLRSKRTETKAEIRSCTRHDCLLHKYELTKGINTSVDPCSDITAYVCSGLKPGPDYPNEMGLIRRWDEKGADYLERNQFHFKVTRKAAAMYRSCVKQEHANLTSAVIGFLRARGLHWPNEESSTVDPLDVVLDLLVNWGVPFWFEINLRKLPSQNRHSLSIGPVYSRGQILAEYNQFQSRSRFFIEYWIETAIEHKNVTSNWPYDDTLLTRNVRYSPVVKYAYFWNSIFVHMAALASPIFYANEMFSANYGGIGTLISQEVFRIFDKHAIALDVFRKNHSWMPEVSKRVLKAKKACFKAQHARLSDTAALLIAHRAYESAVQSPNSDTYAEDLGDNLTSDRVFFLTHCRTKCTVYPKRKNCHHAVRHLKAFGKAFRCGKNSPMVSPAMCSIF